MSRPHKKRRVCFTPSFTLFKPAGVPIKKTEIVELRLDELEAMRLANLEGLYQEDGAKRMNTSRATFGRILTDARRKVTDAIINGKPISVEGGNVSFCEGGDDGCENAANCTYRKNNEEKIASDDENAVDK